MQTSRPKWRADRGVRAIKHLALIEASISALTDEDLLDLADIFAEGGVTPLHEIATTEMTRRNIRL